MQERERRRVEFLRRQELVERAVIGEQRGGHVWGVAACTEDRDHRVVAVDVRLRDEPPAGHAITGQVLRRQLREDLVTQLVVVGQCR